MERGYLMPFASEGKTKEAGKTARDLAADASRDCPFCEGQGLRTVYHPLYRGNAVSPYSEGRMAPLAVAAHCLCPLGLFFRTQCPADLLRRIPMVSVVARDNSGSLWRLDPPVDGPAVTYPDRPVDAESFRALRQRISRLRIGKGS